MSKVAIWISDGNSEWYGLPVEGKRWKTEKALRDCAHAQFSLTTRLRQEAMHGESRFEILETALMHEYCLDFPSWHI